jgi:enoyl-CoA hydratase/carnithine racemase
MGTVDYQQVLADEEDGVGVVTLNRPEHMNAYTWRLGLEMRHAIASFDARDDIRAIVVTGAGRAFCAGADLSSGGDTFNGRADPERAKRAAEEQREVAATLKTDGTHYWDMNTPIIAAINGAAVGVGLTMPMQWDIRIAAEDAKLGFVFNRRGIIPELAAPWIVPRVVGLSRGLELLVTGKIITGKQAADWGLVSSAVPRDEVLPAAKEMARDIAANVAPVSAAIVKRLVYRDLEETDPRRSEARNHKLFAWTATQPDSREGPVAFLEKRAPAWKLGKNADFPEELFSREL